MGFDGLVWAVLAAFWLVYLVPLFLTRRDNGLLEESEPGSPITPAVTIVRRGRPLAAADAEQVAILGPAPTSLEAVHAIDKRAADRRRRALFVLVGAFGLTGSFVLGGVLPPMALAVPGLLLAGYLAVARVLVVRLRAELDAHARRLRGDEEAVEDDEEIVVDEPLVEAEEPGLDLAAPVEVVASLWDPIPVTPATYVSQPLGPRTVRTIDLSAPVAARSSSIPVTADAPVPAVRELDPVHAVGE